MWLPLCLAWLGLAHAAAPTIDDARAVRAERGAVAGLTLAGVGLATTGTGAWLRWSPEAPVDGLVGSGVMGAGTTLLWVGSGVAAFQSLRVARLRGAPLGAGSAALGLWTASLATQLLFAYGAPAALATTSALLSVAQLRAGRRGRTTVVLHWVVPGRPRPGESSMASATSAALQRY